MSGGESRRVLLLQLPRRPEVLDGESSTLRRLELVESLLDGGIGDLDDLDDLLDAPTEVVHPSGEEETGSTDSCWSTTGSHPVSVESLDESNGVRGDLLGFLLELQESGESGDVEGGIHDGDGDVEGLDELEVGGTWRREVEEEVRKEGGEKGQLRPSDSARP